MIKKPDCSKKIFIYHLKDKAYQNQYPKKLINKKRKIADQKLSSLSLFDYIQMIGK